MRRFLPTILIVILALARGPSETRAGERYPERWNMVGANLSTGDKACDDLIDILKLSKECGCTHILLQESRMARLCEQQEPEYYERVKRVLAAAKELDLKLVMSVFSLGYGGKYTYFSGNLMAGLPVKDMPFIVKGGVAEPDPAATLPLVNGGFEASDGDKAVGWGAQKYAGVSAFIDKTVIHSGKQSLRFGKTSDMADRGAKVAVVSQGFDVKRFQYYRVSYYARYEEKYPHLIGIGCDTQRKLAPGEWWLAGRKKPEDWGKFEMVFNTLDSNRVTISLQAYDRPDSVWVDDVKVEPAGLMLLIRRGSAPFTVTSEDGKTAYEEGKDFKPVFDPVMNAKPFSGEIDIHHKAAVIELTSDSRIKDGQKLLASFYHTLRIGEDQDVISIQEPEVRKIMENEIKGVAKYWPGWGCFMNYDEIRMGGWEPIPGGEKLTCGQILARNVKQSYDMIRKYAPDAKIYTWSDMFNPYHNARPGIYWLANGNWQGSWEGLPKDVIILSWYDKPECVKFFADRGHQQVLCGYYDHKGTDPMKGNIRSWKTVSEGVPGILGFMYTNWKKNWQPMKEYFQLLDTYDQWVTTMPAPKSPAPAATTKPASGPTTKPPAGPPR